MNDLSPSDLKAILHSKRANHYLLEHCRVLVIGGRVEYVTDDGKRSLYWNIPIANTTSLLLGTGTSITQAAMRELAKAGVLVGFCGGGGTPLFSANEVDVEVAWLTPQSEYRPTEYLQHWVRFWFDDALRLGAAKAFQRARLERIRTQWLKSKTLKDAGFAVDARMLEAALDAPLRQIDSAPDNTFLLTEEARLSKQLYKLAAQTAKYGDFTRARRGQSADPANALRLGVRLTICGRWKSLQRPSTSHCGIAPIATDRSRCRPTTGAGAFTQRRGSRRGGRRRGGGGPRLSRGGVDHRQLDQQVRQHLGHRAPHHLQIDGCIAMRDLVAHVADRAPGYLRMPCHERRT